MTDVDIEGIVRELEDNHIALVLAPGERLSDISTNIVRYHTNKDGVCVYISIAKPCTTLEQTFRERGVKTDHIFYLDCASELAGSGMTRADNAVFLKPAELTQLSIAMEQVVEGLPKEKDPLLLMDTLNTLAIYNDEETVTRFAHSMVSRIRKWDIKSVILSQKEETDEHLRSRLSQLVDTTIDIR